MLTHLGLEVDQRMVRGTTGIDVVLGGHNHVVINPPQELTDCSADTRSPGFIWAVDPNLDIRSDGIPPNDELHPDPVDHPYQFKRKCTPRKVIISHSGAFSKYVGRLDLVVSNEGTSVDPVNGYEVVSSKYIAYPIDASVPEDPVVSQMLEPYRRGLDLVADLDILVGYSPNGAKRTSSTGGDSPLGNMVATGMWLRLGIQTDFSLTNSTGLRTDLNPGPVTVEEMYNIFPFDNSISKMQLSGFEVQELFDFVARRSAGRGCTAQSQVAGTRVRLNCAGCTRPDVNIACATDDDCAAQSGKCENNRCKVEACAETVYIGHLQSSPGDPIKCHADDGSELNNSNFRCCKQDTDCGTSGSPGLPGQCDRSSGRDEGLCLSAISPTNLYELATSNYLAAGGSGYRVLQRNTTQFDTKIQQRDALIDYLRQGKPCGYDKKNDTAEGLRACSTNADCGADGAFVCACPGSVTTTAGAAGDLQCQTQGTCDLAVGRCVLATCRDEVAQFHQKRCAGSPAQDFPTCTNHLNACSLGGESCKYLACVDETIGNFSDGRLEMLGR
jgi:5'-nucleotidase